MIISIMRNNLNKNGLTLIELIAVLIILGIIAGISIFTIGNIISNSQTKAYEETVSNLNHATEIYAFTENITTDDIFDGLDTNSERLSILFSNGYLNLLPQPVSPYSFVWDITSQTWTLEDEFVTITPPSTVIYDCETSRLVEVIEQGALITAGSFSDSGTSIDTQYGLLFIDNDNDEYTINISAALTTGTYGGYGVFFETKLNDALKDTGYIVQLDRGFDGGQIIVRHRTNGSEESPELRFSVLFDDGGNGDFVLTGGTKNNSNPWWIETHNMQLTIELNDDPVFNKKVSVYIDDVFLFEYAFESDILPGEESLNQTGIRVWTKMTYFYSIEIS